MLALSSYLALVELSFRTHISLSTHTLCLSLFFSLPPSLSLSVILCLPPSLSLPLFPSLSLSLSLSPFTLSLSFLSVSESLSFPLSLSLSLSLSLRSLREVRPILHSHCLKFSE